MLSPVNTTFKSALSKDIVAEHPEIWFRVRFHIIDDPICYELKVFSIARDTSIKCYSSKSFLSFKELSFLHDNARPHVANTVRDFCSVQHTQPLPRPAHSSDVSPIENV